MSDLRSKRRERRYPRRTWPQALVLLVSVVAALVLALYQFTVPAIVPAGAPATEFSAQRAREDLEVIADEPRPVGSRGHAEARRYILQVLKTSGLDPRVQTTTAIEPLPEGGAAVAARVKKILVRLPGTSDSHSAVLLSAHYDSWSGATPGASDCGSCVVTLVETLRALEAGPPLKHDVIFLFTDAEERISLGAKGFVEDDPWADDERMIFNFEGAGSHGPVMILQTTEPNGRLGRHRVGEHRRQEGRPRRGARRPSRPPGLQLLRGTRRRVRALPDDRLGGSRQDDGPGHLRRVARRAWHGDRAKILLDDAAAGSGDGSDQSAEVVRVRRGDGTVKKRG